MCRVRRLPVQNRQRLTDVEGHGRLRPVDLPSVGSNQKFVELLEKGTLALGTDETLGDFTIREHEQRWNAHDAVLHRDIWIVIDIQLGDGQVVAVLIGDLVKDRCDLLARSAPLCPEVDYDRLVRTDDCFIECVAGQVDDFVCHDKSQQDRCFRYSTRAIDFTRWLRANALRQFQPYTLIRQR